MYYKWVIFQGVKYSVNNYVCTFNDDDMPSFAELMGISISDSLVTLLLKCYLTCTFDEHLGAYHICAEDTINSSDLITKPLESVSVPLLCCRSYGKLFVANVGI